MTKLKLTFLLGFMIWINHTMAQQKAGQLASGADLTRYKTFGFLDIDTSGLINPAHYLTNIEVLKNAVRAEMKKKGYQEASIPDLKINMGIVVEEKTQTRETNFVTDRPRYMGQRNYSWQSEDVVVGYYKSGTLDLHLIDAAAGAMVWRATVEDVLPAKQKNMAKTINRNVEKLFKQFPGGK